MVYVSRARDACRNRMRMLSWRGLVFFIYFNRTFCVVLVLAGVHRAANSSFVWSQDLLAIRFPVPPMPLEVLPCTPLRLEARPRVYVSPAAYACLRGAAPRMLPSRRGCSSSRGYPRSGGVSKFAIRPFCLISSCKSSTVITIDAVPGQVVR